MTVVVLLVGGLLAAAISALSWRMAAAVFASPVLQRTNHRGVEIPVATGVVMVLAVVVVAAVAHLAVPFVDIADEIAWSSALASLDAGVLAALGFGLLGLLDDLVGDASRRGFRGHIAAALHGQLTTGFVKLAGGVLVGLLVVTVTAGAGTTPVGAGLDGALEAVSGGLVVAAAANLGNLFDRAPGRVLKVSVLGLAVVAACGLPVSALAGPVVVVAAGLGLLGVDLAERAMLGDTGANALGAAVGLGLVSALGASGEGIALALLIVLNLVSERVSFSRVIDAVPPLAFLDRLGRR